MAKNSEPEENYFDIRIVGKSTGGWGAEKMTANEAKEMWEKLNRWLKENKLTVEQFVGSFGLSMYWAFHFGRFDSFLKIYNARIKAVKGEEL